MKRTVIVLFVFGLAVSLSAQQVPSYQAASGTWILREGRLYQDDARARLAKVNFPVPQVGPMLYEFNFKYEGGVVEEKEGVRHGGFGIHIYVDNARNRATWGAGKSYLLWLNYDENPGRNSKIKPGLTAQVYKSINNSEMQLLHSVDLNDYVGLLAQNLDNPVRFRIWVNNKTGEVRIYDPSDPSLAWYYSFSLEKPDGGIKGNYVALRTNGLKASFGLGLGL
jgi:hypothetical protein